MSILIIKAEIEGLPRPTWRRIAVPSTATIDQLHIALQEAFQWNDYHMHEFTTSRGERFGMPGPDEDLMDPSIPPLQPERMFDVPFLFAGILDTACYVYDFGDNWEHLLTLEAIIEEVELEFPQIVSFSGPSLPEDAGGVPGYLDKLKTLSKPKSADFNDISAWMEAFIPPPLNIPLANAKLKSKIRLIQKIAEIAPFLDEEED